MVFNVIKFASGQCMGLQVRELKKLCWGITVTFAWQLRVHFMVSRLESWIHHLRQGSAYSPIVESLASGR